MLFSSKIMIHLFRIDSKKKQKGLSLIEASMVLVLSAIVVAGTMAYYETALQNNKLDQTTALILHIASQTKTSFMNSNEGYKGINIPTIHTLLPDVKLNASGNIALPFTGGNMNISAGVWDTARGIVNPAKVDGFSLELTNVPVTVCQRVLGFHFGPSLVYKGGILVGPTHKVFNTADVIKGDQPIGDVVKLCDSIAMQANNTAVGHKTATYRLFFK